MRFALVFGYNYLHIVKGRGAPLWCFKKPVLTSDLNFLILFFNFSFCKFRLLSPQVNKCEYFVPFFCYCDIILIFALPFNISRFGGGCWVNRCPLPLFLGIVWNPVITWWLTDMGKHLGWFRAVNGVQAAKSCSGESWQVAYLPSAKDILADLVWCERSYTVKSGMVIAFVCCCLNMWHKKGGQTLSAS